MTTIINPTSAKADGFDRQSTRSASFSHIGLVRTTNEDRILDDADRGIFAVADGMGGHSLGDWAATNVIQALLDIPMACGSRIEIANVLQRANARVHALAEERGVTCGSTIAGLSIESRETGLIFWAGDSRVYRLRGTELQRLSRDHSVVQDLLDANVLSEAEARRHPRANVITRALGVWAQVEIAFLQIALAPGDVFLICTDGISGALSDNDIFHLIQLPLDAAALALRDSALRLGGKDNLSAVLVTV